MAIQAMWVHGNTVCTQETTDKLQDVPYAEHSALLGERKGGGITFRGRGGKTNWFHFCIPTPCWRDDNDDQPGGGHRARLKKIFVLFEAPPEAEVDPGVHISAVHVWDGSTRKFEKNNLGIGGKHTVLPDPAIEWELPDKPEVFYGVGISVEIAFPRDGNIIFVAAGADFYV